MQTFFSIVLGFLLACACSHYAKQRGRNPKTWFILGALFGILSLITLFILPILKIKQAEVPVASKTPELFPLFPLHAEKFWYYLDEEKKQLGPMSFSALSKAWSEGVVRELTFVWNEEMENWKHFKDVTKLEQS